MEYITSRGFALPTSRDDMENYDWFNMWKKKNFPYYELLVGDTLYWFDTKAKRLKWKTEVISINRYKYNDKKETFAINYNPLGKQYDKGRPQIGYYLGYKVKVIEGIGIPKPKNFSFPQLGWLRVDDKIAQLWFKRNQIEDSNTLDDNIQKRKKSIGEQLVELNQKMQDVSPERIEKLVSMTIRKDTKIIYALKNAVNFKCQFPDCGQQIKKRNGEFYIEVAHIKPVAQGGQSVLGNLLALCPNHHKEFDYGKLLIREQTPTKIVGQLNNKDFDIKIIN